MLEMFYNGPYAPGLRVGYGSNNGSRPHQQDAAAAIGRRFAVFDGLGGHTDGEVAASIAAAAFRDTADQTFEAGIKRCHAVVLNGRRNRDSSSYTDETGGFTTLAAVEVQETSYKLAWCGDSRVYVFRRRNRLGSRIEQVTKDHRFGRHRLAACLGYSDCESETKEVGRQLADILILATDGLFEFIDLEAVVEVYKNKPAQALADALLATVSANKTEDNATVIVVKVGQKA